MEDRLVGLARRREQLIARARLQRAAIAESCRHWQRPARMVDRGMAVFGFLRSHPLAAGIGAAAVLALGRRNLVQWAGRGWMLWRAWRSLDAWAHKRDRP